VLLLVTILLVLVAAVTLLIGIFSDELALIFISIGASALAAIVLAVLSQMSRKKGRDAASEAKAPETLPSRQESTAASEEVAQQAAASIEEIGEPVVRADEPTASVPAGGVALPIENYDALRVNEILPQLEGLDLDELETVAQHEESRKNRTTVLNRIDTLMDQLEAAEAAAPAGGGDQLAQEAVASIEEIGEPVVALDDADADAATATAADDGFPIPNYDSLSAAELIPLLDDLDADQLEAVADREEAGPNRDAVLDAIDDRLDILEGIVPAPAAAAPAASADETALIDAEEAADELPVEAVAPAATRAPAKKSTAKKAAAKKAPARKVAATAPAPAKKAATTAKKAAPVKATKKTLEPVKKAPAATRATKAAAAVKAAPATARKASTVRKAPAATKATATKAAKKAAKR